MPNPLYTPKKNKHTVIKAIVFQCILAFLVLVMIKMTPESIGTDWSWWIITAPIWVPLVLAAVVFLIVWLLFVLDEYWLNDDTLDDNGYN